MPETLVDLAARVGGHVVGDGSVTVTDVTHDSRAVTPGALFVAVRGANHDGHDHVAAAVAAGAAAVCVDHHLDIDVPQLVVPGTRRMMGALADAVWGHPTGALTVIGVTGTNGKTTVTHLLAGVCGAAGETVAVIGTTGVMVDGDRIPLPHTTPEATDVHRLAAALRDRGVTCLAMEVSSHALALGRVDAVDFDAVAFTNLGRDHLDFHGDMETYFDTKALLFDGTARTVVNVDDPWGRRLDERVHADVSVGREVVATDVTVRADGATFTLHTPRGDAPVALGLGGRFNVQNALVAAGVGHALGYDPATIATGLAEAPLIPGRFEPVRAGQPFGVVVDYAHTPEAVALAVASAREATSGRVIVVIGAGGERDTEKRRPMGRAAADADLVVVTSDNPRREDPLAIMAEVRTGAIEGTAEVRAHENRREAIAIALRAANPGDVVLILGKGHEVEQDLGDRTIAFDDRSVARALLEATP